MAGIKITAADKWFSLAIREANNWVCESSGVIDELGRSQGSSRGMECCHIFGRRSRNTRWYPLNAFCLTTAQHFYFTERPLEFTDFVKQKLGDGAYEILLERSRDVYIKYTKEERDKQIPKHYREEYRRMRALRKEGEAGPIKLISYD